MEPSKPLLLLDIDGTLCPDGPGPERPMTRLRGGVADDKHFRADLPAILGELGARYELVWATAWEHHANLILAPVLRLPSLPVVPFTDPAPAAVGRGWAGRTWKLPSVQRFAGERAIAWIDDDLHADAYTWAALRRIPTTLIRTDGRIGLTDDHIRALLAAPAAEAGASLRGLSAAGPRMRSASGGKSHSMSEHHEGTSTDPTRGAGAGTPESVEADPTREAEAGTPGSVETDPTRGAGAGTPGSVETDPTRGAGAGTPGSEETDPTRGAGAGTEESVATDPTRGADGGD